MSEEQTDEPDKLTEELIVSEEQTDERNTVFIGRKPVMSYVLAVITHFNTADAKEVVLKARGRAITTAVDTAEITRRRFMDKLTIDKIEIGTEELAQEDGRTRAVSTIEIHLTLP